MYRVRRTRHGRTKQQAKGKQKASERQARGKREASEKANKGAKSRKSERRPRTIVGDGTGIWIASVVRAGKQIAGEGVLELLSPDYGAALKIGRPECPEQG
ncbi:hypothetical protein BDV11DRAFT_114497 [Aspergillus similis]